VAVCAHDHDYRLAALARHVVGYRIHGAVTRPPLGLTAGLPKSRGRSGAYPASGPKAELDLRTSSPPFRSSAAWPTPIRQNLKQA
jgi:hypothetical protein